MSGPTISDNRLTMVIAAPHGMRLHGLRRFSLGGGQSQTFLTGRAATTGSLLLFIFLLFATAGFTGCGPVEQAATSELIGEPAPQFQAERLDGGEFSLADHLGKDIVILDFWATWCGPCVKAMPQIVKAANEHRDQGVVLYAVNQGEDARTIKAFLAEEKLSVDVLLDSDGSVGNRYAVSGIPETVIIGRDGKIKAVHIGYGTGLGKQLRAELDRLVAGKDLPADSTP